MTLTKLLTFVVLGGLAVPTVYWLERVRLLAGLHHKRRHPERQPVIQAAPPSVPFWADADRTELLRPVAEAPPVTHTGWRAAPQDPPIAGWGGAGHGH